MISMTAMAGGSVASDPDGRLAWRGAESASPVLTAEQIQRFWADGYLLVDDVTSGEEIAAMRVVYDRLFAERAGWDNGDLFDMVARDDLRERDGNDERPAVEDVLDPAGVALQLEACNPSD